jgi:ribosomal-protein-alanine N-acetyltransferase
MGVWADDFKNRGYCKFRLTDRATGEFLGRAGFGVHEDMPEIGYALLPKFWGKGYAAEAATALRDWIFTERDHEFFIGYAYTANKASTHILQKIGMGFTHTDMHEGKELSFYKLTKEQWHG